LSLFDDYLNLIISTKELYKLVKNKKQDEILVVDTRSFSEYKKGHIPGAINLDLFQLHWIDTTTRGIKDFNRQCRLLLSNVGVGMDKRIVFYDDISGISAPRGVWLLLYFGNEKVCLLDGGFEKWNTEKLPIEVKSNALKPIRFKGKPNFKLIAGAYDVNKSISKKNVIIVDARSLEEYDGSEIRAARRGHIPSAVHIEWITNIENEVFKSKEKLSKIYSKLSKDSEIITYCQGGYRAANSFVALNLIGYKKVKMYLGSWGEWGNRLEYPVEK
jgi:thiosulfate/3-mercaptopyruvate sulfurtransferase